MLYQAYQAQNDVLTPIRLMAEAARGFWSQPWPLIGDHPLMRGAAAACEMLSRSGISHQRPAFGITEARVGKRVFAVAEEALVSHPFCTLLHFAKQDCPIEQPRVLVVAPLSGHFATLLRGTVETLLQDHDVYITDWRNARDAPLSAGAFGFDEYVAHVISFLETIGPGAHLLGVCQPCAHALAAVSIMAED